MKIRILCTLWCLFFVFSLAACSRDDNAKKIPLAPKRVKAETLVVETNVVPSYVSFPGLVAPKVRVAMAAKIPGYVRFVGVQEGELVKKGDILIRLDDVGIRSKLQGLIEKKRAIIRERAAFLARYRYQKANFLRIKGLFREEAATQDELDRAKEAYMSTKERLDAYGARIRAVEEEIREARNELKYVEIKSPVTGWVTKRFIDPGSFVGAGALLLEIDSRDSGFWFVSSIYERLLDSIKEGSAVVLDLDSSPSPIDAKIARIIPKVDPKSHTFTVKVDLEDMDVSVRSGEFGRIWIKTGEVRGLLVPFSAVVQRGGIKGIYCVDQDNVIHWRVVTLDGLFRKGPHGLLPLSIENTKEGGVKGLMACVSSGLVPGTKIVISNPLGVQEGMILE